MIQLQVIHISFGTVLAEGMIVVKKGGDRMGQKEQGVSDNTTSSVDAPADTERIEGNEESATKKPAPSKKPETTVVAALAYLVFFIPLLVAKEDSFARYHANQGLLLLILAVGIQIVGIIIPILGWFVIVPLGYLLVLVFAIMGIVTALKGEKKPLPLVGEYTLLD